MSKSTLTAERLRHLLDYDPDTGLFTWKVSPARNVKDGQVAGSINDDGYLRIRFDGKAYAAHRLAWLYMTGEFPPADVDHKNGIRSDNRWANLRAATRTENSANHKGWGTSGVRGVRWCKKTKKWQARIRVNGTLYRIGTFSTVEEANACYQGFALLVSGEFAAHRSRGQ